MPKQGTGYELFVKEVYEVLNKTDGLSDVQIQHDVKLVGAAGVEHQIDVYWTFSIAGIRYQVAVECKEYKNRISKEKIEAFHSILHDIGNITGIFATTVGFQSGAEKYAKKYGIQLMEIRRPNDSDWNGRIKNFQIDLHIRTIANMTAQVFADKEKLNQLNICLPDGNHVSQTYPCSTIIHFDEMIINQEVIERNSQIQLADLYRKLPIGEPSTGNVFVFKFTNGIIDLEEVDLPIATIQFTYDICESVNRIAINGEDEIKAIIKDRTKGSITQIRRNGKVIKE